MQTDTAQKEKANPNAVARAWAEGVINGTIKNGMSPEEIDHLKTMVQTLHDTAEFFKTESFLRKIVDTVRGKSDDDTPCDCGRCVKERERERLSIS